MNLHVIICELVAQRNILLHTSVIVFDFLNKLEQI